VDIEVKTPGFSHLKPKGKIVIPTVLLNENGLSLLERYCNQNELILIKPRMRKLVDFINSATEKFEMPTDKHLNLLYINWTYSEFPSNSYLEVYSILNNTKNGLLNHKDLGIKMGICEEAYDKISAVIVYTSSLNTIIFQDFRYLWSTRHFAIIPMIVDTKFLLQITDMDYRKNRNMPKIMCDFNSITVDEHVDEAMKCLEINKIIDSNLL
jgi:hypothetical protein